MKAVLRIVHITYAINFSHLWPYSISKFSNELLQENHNLKKKIRHVDTSLAKFRNDCKAAPPCRAIGDGRHSSANRAASRPTHFCSLLQRLRFPWLGKSFHFSTIMLPNV